MSPQKKVKKMIIKIPRHPFIIAENDLNYSERLQLRKCRVNLERIKGVQSSGNCHFPLTKSKAKRCCVRVARLPNDERSEMSVTPANSIVCSDFDDETSVDFTASHSTAL